MRYDRPINFHAILGLWELSNFEILSKVFVNGGFLKGEMVVCDVGANLGIYSLWFSKLLRGRGIIYAFEPSPEIAGRLRENISLNDAGNVEMVELACSDKSGTTEFFLGGHHHISSLHADWAAAGVSVSPRKVIVRSSTLDDFSFGGTSRKGPDFIKMDIEGGGTLALKGCSRCVQEKRPIFLMESHTPDKDRAICDLIGEHDYQAYRVEDHSWVKNLTKTFPDKQGVWGVLLLCPSEARGKLSRVLT